MSELHIPQHLPDWAENSLEKSENILATSNQGTILLYREQGAEFILKTAMGSARLLL